MRLDIVVQCRIRRTTVSSDSRSLTCPSCQSRKPKSECGHFLSTGASLFKCGRHGQLESEHWVLAWLPQGRVSEWACDACLRSKIAIVAIPQEDLRQGRVGVRFTTNRRLKVCSICDTDFILAAAEIVQGRQQTGNPEYDQQRCSKCRLSQAESDRRSQRIQKLLEGSPEHDVAALLELTELHMETQKYERASAYLAKTKPLKATVPQTKRLQELRARINELLS